MFLSINIIYWNIFKNFSAVQLTVELNLYKYTCPLLTR